MNPNKIEKFSFDTIQNFDKHILQSIPNYDLLFDSILKVSKFFLDESMNVYDIGCSTGKLLKALDFKGNKIGLDNCINLLPKSNDIEFINVDLNQPYIFEEACLIFSIFTFQFLQKRIRSNLIRQIYNGLNEGGAFIFVEKTLARNTIMQEIFTFAYYDFKKKFFTEKEILDKEVSLRRILKPNTSLENYEMLKEVGFKKIEKFYKYFHFEGYLCIK